MQFRFHGQIIALNLKRRQSNFPSVIDAFDYEVVVTCGTYSGEPKNVARLINLPMIQSAVKLHVLCLMKIPRQGNVCKEREIEAIHTVDITRTLT